MESAANDTCASCPYYIPEEEWCELYDTYPLTEYGEAFRSNYCLNERQCFRCKYDSTFASFAKLPERNGAGCGDI